MNNRIGRLAVIGVGLIGGSLARALRAAACVDEIVGCGRGRANLDKAVELGVIDRYSHDVAEAVRGADLVFLGVPLGAKRVQLEDVGAPAIQVCVEGDDNAIVFVDSTLPVEDAPHDPAGFGIEHDHSEVDRPIVEGAPAREARPPHTRL